jgi:hypothetical protein
MKSVQLFPSCYIQIDGHGEKNILIFATLVADAEKTKVYSFFETLNG